MNALNELRIHLADTTHQTITLSNVRQLGFSLHFVFLSADPTEAFWILN